MSIPTLSFVIDATNRFAPAFDDLAAAMTQGVYKGNLMASTIGFAMNKVGEGVSFVSSKINEATELQLANISASTTFASLTGATFEQAADVIESLNARLAKSASALPGVTQDYKDLAMGIQSNVVEAFKNPDGKLRVKDWEDAISSMTESYGALTAATTKDTGNTKMSLIKALGGQVSMAELSNMSFFEKNINVRNELMRLLKDQGKTELKQLNLAQRVDVLTKAAQKFITDDFKKRAGGSVDGLIQSYNTTLFDPTEGIFGIMRKFGSGQNKTSAFAEYNKMLDALIGNDGLFGNIGKLISTLMGWDADTPMKALASVFQAFTAGITRINTFVSGINKSIEGVGGSQSKAWDIVFKEIGKIGGSVIDSLSAIIPGFIDSIVQTIPNALSGIIDLIPTLINFISGAIISAGSALAKIGLALVNGLITMDWGKIFWSLGTALFKIDWGNVVKAFFTVIAGQAILGVGASIFGAIATVIGGAFATISLAGTVISGIASLLSFMLTGVISSGLSAIGVAAAPLFATAVPALLSGVILPIGVFVAAFAATAWLLGYSVDDLKDAASGWIATVEKASGIKIDGLGSAITGMLMAYGDGFKGFYDGISAYFNSLIIDTNSYLNTIRSTINIYWTAISAWYSGSLVEIQSYFKAIGSIFTPYWNYLTAWWVSQQAEIQYYTDTVNNAVKPYWNALISYWGAAQAMAIGLGAEVNYQFTSWGKTFTNGWESAVKVLSDVLIGIKQSWEDLKKTANDWISPLKTSIDALFKGIADFIASIKLPSISMPTISMPSVTSAVATVTNAVAPPGSAAGNAVKAVTDTAAAAASAMTDATKAVGNAVSNAAAVVTNPTANLPVPNATPKWRGNIPSASNGLFEAIKSEQSNMPGGASLAIANTSEYIMTPRQMENFVNNTSGGGVNVSFGNIVINGVNDPQNIAEAVMREMSAQLEEYLQGQLV